MAFLLTLALKYLKFFMSDVEEDKVSFNVVDDISDEDDFAVYGINTIVLCYLSSYSLTPARC